MSPAHKLHLAAQFEKWCAFGATDPRGVVRRYTVDLALANGVANHNPAKSRAHAIAAEVRARRPEMQVRRLAAPLNDVN